MNKEDYEQHVIKTGDKVKRNNLYAIYDEDVCPDDMDHNKEYVVKVIHDRFYTSGMHEPKTKYKTVEVEGLRGEISVALLDKVSD